MTRILTILSLIPSLQLVNALPLYAQTQIPADTSDQGLASLVLVVDVAQSAEQMSAPFHVLVTIQNPTEKEWAIDSLLVELPPAVSETRAYEPTVTCLQQSIGPQSTVRCLKMVPRGGMSPFGSFIRHTLFFLPGSYPLTAILLYREGVPEKPIRVELSQETVVLHPPIVSILGGGVIGAALVAMFLTTYRIRKSNHNTLRSVLLDIGGGILLAVFGSIVAIIAILLFQQTNDIGLPIGLEVADYRGGIVIGLFSIYLGELFYQRFREAQTKGSPSPQTNPAVAERTGDGSPAAR